VTGEPAVLAAGAVLWRGDPQAPDVALVHRPRYDDWTLPKGKLDRGEHPLVAAVREVREETGQQAAAGRFLGRQHYPVSGPAGQLALKQVSYWTMRASTGDFVPGPEVDQVVWLPVKAARRAVTYRRDREPLRRFAALPPDLRTVLFVRHARAGSRRTWHGEDDQRPLDAPGQRQALLLRDVALAFIPAAVHSAPLVRCRQTVSPLAEQLGVKITDEDVLSDDAVARNARPGLRRMRQIALAEATAAVCAQGDAIPSLVRTLADADGVPLGQVRSRKGSVWVLSFRADRLVDASYLADLEPPIPRDPPAAEGQFGGP
jgi:8-oxo-dGTP diphosphatase